MKKKKNKSTIFTIISMVIILVVCIGVFYWKANETDDNKVETGNLTESEKLISYDMENQYPQTPREVMRLYCRMAELLYSGELNEDQVESLVDNIRKMYDEELLQTNKRDAHLKAIQNELEEYKEKKWKIKRYTVEEAKELETVTVEGRESTTVQIYFSRQEGTAKFVEIYESFILRMDDEGLWKILGWKAFNPEGDAK